MFSNYMYMNAMAYCIVVINMVGVLQSQTSKRLFIIYGLVHHL